MLCFGRQFESGLLILRLGARRTVFFLLLGGMLTTAACAEGGPEAPDGTVQSASSAAAGPPDEAGPRPENPSGPADNGEMDELYEYCETAPAGDASCSTGLFGNNREAAEKFLEGADVGPGGLEGMTASDDGFPGGSPVGSSVSLVNATWNVDISEVVESGDTCEVLIDRNSQLGAVIDLDGIVQAFVIQNPVVETAEGIRVGSPLDDLQARYPVEVQEYGPERIAYTVRENVASDRGDVVEPSRAMLFYLSADDVVEMWVVGATSYVEGTLSEGLCPVG